VVGTAYSHAFPASGGTPPYAFSIDAGASPPGLHLNGATGVASGTPTASGTFYFTIGVVDSLGASYSVDCSISISLALSLDCASPPDGSVGAMYSHSFPAAGGVPPYAFSVTAGALPTGVDLNAATGLATGIPTAAGVSTFTVTVADSLSATFPVNCSIAITGSVPVPPAPPASGGLPTAVVQAIVHPFHLLSGTCRIANYWDDCLAVEERRLSSIRFPSLCAMPAGFRRLLPWDDEAVALPYQAVPFNRAGSIVTPAPADGDQVVVSLPVPLGYDGFLTAAYWSYIGAGFSQGSGDLIFRIKINQRYLKDLSNIPFALGSPRLPFPFTEGQLLLCGQTVSGIVNAPNPGGTVQAGSSRIAFALIGFFWPRGAERRYAYHEERYHAYGTKTNPRTA
jgi:hypothetical protein